MNPMRPLIEKVSALHGIDPNVVEAVVQKESSYNPVAWNPEPRYRYLWDVRKNAPFRPLTLLELSSKFPPPDFRAIQGDPDQEFWAQQASWGLMQLMGAVVREHGYKEPWLTSLVADPELNLEYGCRHLSGLFKWAAGRYTGLAGQAQSRIMLSALAAYNGGKAGNSPENVAIRNREYAESVVQIYLRIKAGP